MVSELYAYYVQTKFTNERFRERTGVYNPITVVVAETEEAAIKNLKDFLKPYDVEVTLPYRENSDGTKVTIANLSDFGHGSLIKDFLDDPQKHQKYRELLDAYIDHYKRYDMQIYDDRGEILWQNDYTQNRNFPQPAQPPKVITVEIPTEDQDEIKAGVGLVAEESENSASGSVLTSEYTTDENGVVIIRQSKLLPDGRILVRSKVGDAPFSDWKLDPVFTEEAPEDGVEYVRQNAKWKAIKYDKTPTSDSNNLVKSGDIKTYVEGKVAKLYKYQGTVETMSDLPKTGLVIGDTYNVKQKSYIGVTIDGTDTKIWCDAGDNVVWNGTSWDNLSGFVDVDSIYSYVDKAVSEIDTPSLGAGYQPIIDDKLETESKVIPTAINEVNSKITNVVAELKAGWNTVKIGKIFPISWVFVSKPYCYTNEGISVDYTIRNWKDKISEDSNTFEINVPVDCNLNCAVSPYSTLPAVYADYMLVSYYYTGADGRDLDTVTELDKNGTIIDKCGYGQDDRYYIKAPDGTIIARWAGDNQGGGTTADEKFYEEVLIDINALRRFTSDPVDVIFYAGWFGAKGIGYINSAFTTYTGTIADITTVPVSNLRFNLTGLTQTYKNPAEMRSYVASRSNNGGYTEYKSKYTSTIKVTITDEHISVSGSTTADPSSVRKLFKVTQLS